MSDYQSENINRSRYGIAKLQDHTYHMWSFQCQMLLFEKKVWKVVNGEHTRPIYSEMTTDTEGKEIPLSTTQINKLQKEIDAWDEKDEEALHIITFTVSDQLQGPSSMARPQKGLG